MSVTSRRRAASLVADPRCNSDARTSAQESRMRSARSACAASSRARSRGSRSAAIVLRSTCSSVAWPASLATALSKSETGRPERRATWSTRLVSTTSRCRSRLTRDEDRSRPGKEAGSSIVGLTISAVKVSTVASEGRPRRRLGACADARRPLVRPTLIRPNNVRRNQRMARTVTTTPTTPTTNTMRRKAKTKIISALIRGPPSTRCGDPPTQGTSQRSAPGTRTVQPPVPGRSLIEGALVELHDVLTACLT